MMRRFSTIAVLTVIVAGLVAGCGDNAGEQASSASTAEASTPPERIVPLNGDIAEIVYALGLGDQVVGTDVSATYPPEARETPKIGYQRTLAAEGILALEPTLVIGTDEAGPPPVIEQIRQAGIEVEIIPAGDGVDAAPTKIRAVADALGVSEEGEELARTVTVEIEAAEERVASVAEKPRVAFLYLRGPQTLTIGGTGSRADAMITAAGGIDAGAEAGVTGFVPLTAEALTQANPEVILVLTGGLESVGGVEGLLALPGVAQTPAGQAQRVLDYDDLYLLGLGPRTGQAIDDLVTGLHPDLPAS